MRLLCGARGKFKEAFMHKMVDLSQGQITVACHLGYENSVAKIESNGDYGIIGGYNNHYLGNYQMGKAALKDVGIGYTKADREAYLSNPDMQEDAFEQFTLQNHNFLRTNPRNTEI